MNIKQPWHVPKHGPGGAQTERCEVMIIVEKADETRTHSSVLCISVGLIKMKQPPSAN